MLEMGIDSVNCVSPNLFKMGGLKFLYPFLDNEDISDIIRTPEISFLASSFATNAIVRKHLFELQRKLGNRQDIIIDGRDIGTVVFPNAQVKIFLTADPKVRAYRRWVELKGAGLNYIYDDILQEIIARDRQDTERKISPLKKAKDAIEVDTSKFSIDEMVSLCLKIIKTKHV